MFADLLRAHLEALRAAVAGLDPERLTGSEAAELCTLFVGVERVGLAGLAICGRRAVESGEPAAGAGAGARAGAGAGAGAGEDRTWLAHVTGDSPAAAGALLVAAGRMEALPSVRQALVEGHLSRSQLRSVTAPRSIDDTGAAALVDVARSASLPTLRAHADRLDRMAMGNTHVEGRDAYAYEHRQLRWQADPKGGVRGTFSLTDADWARCLPRIEATAATLFEEARNAGNFDSIHEYHADALVQICSTPVSGAHGPPPPRGIVRVDASALTRGAHDQGEVCEVAGVGTVSVASARRLLGDSLLHVLVTRGTDVACVTGAVSSIPSVLRMALIERDPACVVPGCTATVGLEIHRWATDEAIGAPVELADLARICKTHLDLHTYKGWCLHGGPGDWGWSPTHRRATPGGGSEVDAPLLA